VAGCGDAIAWCTGETLPAESAAWLNGIAGHVLDYDDVMTPMRGHISIALVPALVALAPLAGADGRRYSAAYIAGFEVLSKFSRVMALPHYSKGWHSTSALGVLGASVACCVLLGLNEAQIENALGIAVAQASGSRQNFGTMTKSFQAGHCGAAAVRAALLARAGFTSAPGAIDGNYGYQSLYADGEDLTAALDSLGRQPLDIDTVGIDIKKYPCCYGTHKALDAVLALRREHSISLDQVRSVEIISSARGLESLLYSRPTTGLEGKFSMEYVTAAALLDGQIRLSTFDDAQVMRPAVQAFLAHVSKREADGPTLPRWATAVIRLKNDNTLEQRIEIGRGDSGDPLTDEDVTAKAEDCFSFGGCKWNAKQFATQVYGMATLNVADLVAGLHGKRNAARRAG
jgi:2-methylcitrate dehydratase PrpD